MDDEQFNREDIEEDLVEEGYHVHLLDRGEAALQHLKQFPEEFHAVLLDRMMPGMSGMEVLYHMKQDEKLQHIPVIFQTAKSNKEDILKGMKAGAYYYLPKPFTSEELLAVVKAAVLKFDEYLNLNELVDEKNQFVRMLSLLKKGRFVLQNLEDVCAVAHALSFPCPDSSIAKTVLLELLVNAVEHGNLEISYQDKTELLEEERWNIEVNHRLTIPPYNSRKVLLDFHFDDEQIEFRIEDEGSGFDWTPYLDFATMDRIFDNHGRGIAICNNSGGFKIAYQGKGNIVVATWHH